MKKYKKLIKESRDKTEEIEKLNNETISHLDGIIDSAGAVQQASTPVSSVDKSLSNPLSQSQMIGKAPRMSMALPNPSVSNFVLN